MEEVRRRSTDLTVVDTRDAKHLTEAVERASRTGLDRIIVCGGDGTFHLAIQRANLATATFAIIPLGSGDDLASALSMPRETRAAVSNAFDGEVRCLDVGAANGFRFMGSVSLGFDARVARRAAATKGLRGSLLYVASTLRELPSFRPLRVAIEADGVRREQIVMFLVVANSPRYGGGVLIAPDARIDDGQLDVITVGKASKLDLLLTFPAAYKGGHLKKSFVSTERAGEVTLITHAPELLYADGEPIGTTPVTIRLETEKLRLVVPFNGTSTSV